MHPNYKRLVDLACARHIQGRAIADITESDIALARLYSHAFRGQVIGAFHATRRALEAIQTADPVARAALVRADESLADLANRSMDLVGCDARALISTFHHYCTHVARAVEALDQACARERHAGLQHVRDLFVSHMEMITCGNGLHLTRDTGAPEQGCFVVPNLGITIVPLVYGDHHSWNLAWLDGERSDVPCHLHRQGVEIHLGFSPMHGFTILDEAKGELTEGYAMPIPPNTRHGYTNIGGRPHNVPFIFGSFVCGGWGVFLDVEPNPCEVENLKAAPVLSKELNGTVFLEREIAKIIQRNANIRYPIIAAASTDRDRIGGLELSLASVTADGIELHLDRFCTVSVVQGRGILTMAGEHVEITAHDHFGIPAGVAANITADGMEPLVLLDAVLRNADE